MLLVGSGAPAPRARPASRSPPAQRKVRSRVSMKRSRPVLRRAHSAPDSVATHATIARKGFNPNASRSNAAPNEPTHYEVVMPIHSHRVLQIDLDTVTAANRAHGRTRTLSHVQVFDCARVLDPDRRMGGPDGQKTPEVCSKSATTSCRPVTYTSVDFSDHALGLIV